MFSLGGCDKMAEIIIYMVIFTLVSLIFVALGILQYRAKEPVAINTGEKPPEAQQLTDVALWNHKHGLNLIIFAIMLWITGAIFPVVLNTFDNVVVEILLFIVAIGIEILWVEYQHNKMKRTMIKKAN